MIDRAKNSARIKLDLVAIVRPRRFLSRDPRRGIGQDSCEPSAWISADWQSKPKSQGMAQNRRRKIELMN